MPAIVLLGPQRYRPTLGGVLDAYGAKGPFISITAGWEEREGEIGEMCASIGRPASDLGLHRAADEVLTADPALLAAWRTRRLRLRTLRVAYQLRLQHLKATIAQLAHLRGDEGLLAAEQADNMAMMRALDARQIAAAEAVEREFEVHWGAGRHQGLAAAREKMLEMLDAAGAVLIAGGHVGVLLHRIRLFALGEAVREKPIFAWSAGAMALSERVVLFHDRPPQGGARAEVLCAGLGIADGVVLFPHATRRLDLNGSERLALLARRFAPRTAVLLDDGEGLALDGGIWRRVAGGARRLLLDGGIVAVRAA